MLVGEDDSGLVRKERRQSLGAEEDSYGDESPVVQDIDFRRGEAGEGRVIVRLSDVGVGVDVISEGGNIKVEFANTVIPERLQRRLDVTDFATPVITVDSMPEHGTTVMVIEPSGAVSCTHSTLAPN